MQPIDLSTYRTTKALQSRVKPQDVVVVWAVVFQSAGTLQAHINLSYEAAEQMLAYSHSIGMPAWLCELELAGDGRA
jgi:hypothetical protein